MADILANHLSRLLLTFDFMLKISALWIAQLRIEDLSVERAWRFRHTVRPDGPRRFVGRPGRQWLSRRIDCAGCHYRSPLRVRGVGASDGVRKQLPTRPCEICK